MTLADLIKRAEWLVANRPPAEAVDLLRSWTPSAASALKDMGQALKETLELIAAVNALSDGISERLKTKSSPQKYGVPFGLVNDLNAVAKKVEASKPVQAEAPSEHGKPLDYKTMALNYLDDILEAKRLMREAGLEQAEFKVMFAALIERAAHPPASGAVGREDMPHTDDRQLDDPENPDGYLESDNEWVHRNLEAVRWFIDHHAEIRAALATQPLEQKPAAVVRSIVGAGLDGVRLTWLVGFPQIGMRLYLGPQPEQVAQDITDAELDRLMPEPKSDLVTRGSVSTGGGSYGHTHREPIWTRAEVRKAMRAARASGQGGNTS